MSLIFLKTYQYQTIGEQFFNFDTLTEAIAGAIKEALIGNDANRKAIYNITETALQINRWRIRRDSYQYECAVVFDAKRLTLFHSQYLESYHWKLTYYLNIRVHVLTVRIALLCRGTSCTAVSGSPEIILTYREGIVFADLRTDRYISSCLLRKKNKKIKKTQPKVTKMFNTCRTVEPSKIIKLHKQWCRIGISPRQLAFNVLKCC